MASRPQPRTPNEPHYLNINEAANRYGCSPRTIRRYVAAGLLPAARFGPRMLRVSADDLERLMCPVPSAGGAA